MDKSYLKEFARLTFGSWVLDVLAVITAILTLVLWWIGMTVQPWITGLATVSLLFYASFAAFRDVAKERDQLRNAQGVEADLAQVLAIGRSTAELHLDQLEGVIRVGDYDAYYEPIEAWWHGLLNRVRQLSPAEAARLGTEADVEHARRPRGTRQGNMSTDKLAEFLASRIERITRMLSRVSS